MSASPFRARRARMLRTAWLAVLVIAPTLHAAMRPHDYYATDLKSRNLLKMVEGYHLEPGTRKLGHGRYHYAWQDFDFILRYFPNDPKALLLMGELALKTGKPQEAVRYFQTAIRLFPDHAATYTAYGVFLHRAGKLRQAIDQYREALKLDPTSAETHYDLGLAYLDIHDYKRANRHAHTAYRLGYPLPGLRQRLQRLGKWIPAPRRQPDDNRSRGNAARRSLMWAARLRIHMDSSTNTASSRPLPGKSRVPASFTAHCFGTSRIPLVSI